MGLQYQMAPAAGITLGGWPERRALLVHSFPCFMITLLIFLGLALTTVLLAFDTIDNIKAMFQPEMVPVRAN